MATLVLNPFKADKAIEKSGSKKGMIYSYCTWDFEIILILLIKVIAINLRFLQIYL